MKRTLLTLLITSFFFILCSFTLILVVPLFMSSTPDLQNANSISLSDNLVLSFSENIDLTTVNSTNIILRGSQSGVLPTSLSGGGTSQITIDPTLDFSAGEQISLTLTSGITSNSDPLNPLNIDFTTQTSNNEPGTPQVKHQIDDYFDLEDHTNNLFAVDMDNDGDIDVLLASEGYGDIVWKKNNGDGTFTEMPIITTVNQVKSIVPTDLDSDGDLDVVYANYQYNNVAWYRNDGGGTFTGLGAIASLYYLPNKIDAADLDRDGDMDIVISSNNFSVDYKIKWYENDGSQNFTSHDITPSDLSTYDFEIVDVDKDGDSDIVTSSTNGIEWYENTNTSTWPSHSISIKQINNIEAVDIDNDGDIDIISGFLLTVYENDGSQNFTEQVIDNTATTQASTISVTDIDGDGDLDIGGNTTNSPFQWFVNKGNLDFESDIFPTNFSIVYSSDPVDFDNDGDIDVVASDGVGLFWLENTKGPGELKIFANQVHLTSSSPDFAIGEVLYNYPVSYTFLIKNDGDLDLTIAGSNAITIGGTNPGDFSTSSNIDGAVISPGSFLPVEITMNANNYGRKTATISIASDDPFTPIYDFNVTVDCESGNTGPTEVLNKHITNTYTGSIPQGLFDVTGVAEYTAPSGWSPMLSSLLALFGSEINVSTPYESNIGNVIELRANSEGMGDLVSAFPISSTPYSLQGQYKLSGATTDSAIVAVTTGGGVASNRTDANSDTLYITTDASEYALFELPIPYDQNSVDSLVIHLFTTTNGPEVVFTINDMELVDDTEPPVVTSFIPVNNATDVEVDQVLIIEFSENVKASGGPISIYKITDGSIIESIDLNSSKVNITDNMVTIDHEFSFPYQETLWINLQNCFTDMAGNAYEFNLSPYTWTFTTRDKLSQTITFDPLPDKNEGDAPFTISATASSALAVAFTVTSGPATINGNELTLTGAGLVTLTASQSGDGQYAPAPDVSQSFCVLPNKPTITAGSGGTSQISLTSSSTVGNIWFMDAIEMTATGQSVDITEAGIYTVQVDIDGCVSMLSDELSVIVTGVEENLHEVLTVYPNPVNNKITMQFQSAWLDQELEISLLNSQGQVVQNKYLTLKNRAIAEMNVNQIPQGIYILKIRSENEIINYRIQKK